MLLVNATIVGGDANKYLTQGGMIWGKYLTLEDRSLAKQYRKMLVGCQCKLCATV